MNWGKMPQNRGWALRNDTKWAQEMVQNTTKWVKCLFILIFKLELNQGGIFDDGLLIIILFTSQFKLHTLKHNIKCGKWQPFDQHIRHFI